MAENDVWPGEVVSEEEETEFPGQVITNDPELDALLARNPQITITGEEIDDPRVPVGGQLGYDVTDQVRAAGRETSGARDYEYYYGERPEGPGFLTRMGAAVADVSDALTPGEQEPNAVQQERDAAVEAQRQFQERMMALYEESPTAAEYGVDNPELAGGDDVRVDVRLQIDEDGNVYPEYNRIPAPDSSSFERVIDQVGNNIFQQVGGLVTEGAILEESELERRVPDLELEGAEGLVTDLLTFGLPALGAERLGRRAVGVGRLAQLTGEGSRLSRFGTVLGGSIGASFAEAVMSTEGNTGLLISPETVAETFKIESPEAAADLAMFMDGMILNGAFDGVLYLGSRVAGFAAEKTRGVRGFFSPNFVRDESQRKAMLGVINIIDPELQDLPPARLARALTNMATVLEANATAIVRIGETTEEVALDTVNAMSRGAEEYIRATRVTNRRGMTDAEWEQYVATEARDMVDRMIGVARSQEGTAVVRSAVAGMSDGVDRAISTEADRLLTPTPDNPNPLQSGADALVGQRAADVAAATERADAAQTTVDTLTATRGTAVANDPFISELLSSDDPLRFFNNSDQVEQLRGLLGEELFQQYRTAWQNVDNAYKAIPNVPIDTEAFIDSVNTVVRDANLLDASGGQTRRILGEIYRAVQPQAAMDEAGEIVMESAEELLERIDGQIGFQDLYNVRQRLSNMIGETSDPAIQARLRELKDSITDPENGQLAFVARSGNEDAAAAALSADRLFMDTMSRFQNSEPLRQFSNMAAARNAGENTATSDRFLRRGEADISSGVVQNIVPNVMSDPTGFQYTALREAFDNPRLAETLDASVAGLYIAEGTRALADALRGNSNQTPDMIIQAFRSQAQALRQTGNPIYSQLEEAAARIDRLQRELGDDLLVAEEAARIAREEVAQAENTIVSRFLRENATDVATGQPQAVVRQLLNSSNAGDRIEDLMAQIARLPEGQREATQQAFQGAILRSLRDSVFGSTPTGLSSATDATVNTRLGNLSAITGEVRSSVLSGVRAAFPDSPEVVEGIEAALTTLSETSTPSRLRFSMAGSDTAANVGVRDAVSTAILFSFGYMNPTAAAARRLTATQVQRIEEAASQQAVETVAAIVAAPKEFAALSRAIARREDPSMLATLRQTFVAAALDGLRYETRVADGSLAENTMIALEDAFGRIQEEPPEGMDE